MGRAGSGWPNSLRLIVPVAGMLAGCGHLPWQGRVSPCGAAAPDVALVQEVAGPVFKFGLPAGFERCPAVWPFGPPTEWVDGGESVIAYQWGAHANDLSVLEQEPEFQVCVQEIGGRAARVATLRQYGRYYVAAAHWADVLPPGALGRVGVTIYGYGRSREAQRLALAAIRSVHFTGVARPRP